MKKKRLLGFLLSMSLAVSMAMPGTAMAATGTTVESDVAYAEESDSGTDVDVGTAEITETSAEEEATVLLADGEETQMATVTVTSEDELNQAITDAEMPTKIIVANNIELSATLEIPSGKDIILEGASEGISIKAGDTFTATTYRMVYLAGTLTLRNITLDANASSSRLWRVLYMDKNSNCTMEDGAVITGGYTNKTTTSGYGGGVLVYTGSVLTMKEGSQVTGNTVAYSSSTMGGGGVAIYGGTLDMQGGSIDGNTLKRGYGAGVYLYNAAATFKMSGNAVIANNSITGTTASYGGGVGIYRGTCEITGGSITGNTVTKGNGSAIYNTQPGFILKNVTISGNAANDGIGAVYNNNTSGVSIPLEDVTITGNTATSTVAGLYDVNESFSLGGKIVIADNLVAETEKNFNLDLSSGNVITLTGALTEGSRLGLASVSNGDMSGDVCLSAVTLTEEEMALTAKAFYFEDASASNGLGFVYNVPKQCVLWRVLDSSMFVTNAEVHNQQELENALKYASIDEKTTITLKNDIVLTTGITAAANTDITLTSDTAAQTPYTITADDSTYSNSDNYSLLTVKGNLTINNVTIDAAQKCRGIYVDVSAKLTLDNGATIKNGASVYITNGIKGSGLGVYVAGSGNSQTSGELIMKEGSQITGCGVHENVEYLAGGTDFSMEGLGVYVGSGASFHMEGGEISDCLDYEGTLSRDGVYKRAGNTVAAKGGGVYTASDSVFEMTGGKITGNKVYGIGGGIYAGGTVCISENAEVTDNLVLLKEISVSTGNHSDMRPEFCQGGGGIYADGNVVIDGSAKIDGNSTSIEVLLSGNGDDYRGCGGGIMVASGTVTMNGGTISGNTVATTNDLKLQSSNNNAILDVSSAEHYYLANGGGVYVKGGTFTMNGGTITGNKAENTGWTDNLSAGNGGGICLGYTSSNGKVTEVGTVILNGGAIKDNSADTKGADVYVTDLISTTVGGSTAVLNPGTSASLITVAGSPVFIIGSETKDVSVGEVYLPSPSSDSNGASGESVISISSALGEGVGSIGILTESTELGTLIAKSGDSYALRNSDIDRGILNYIGSDADEKGLEINDDGYIVLGNKNTAERTDISEAEVVVDDVSWSGYVQLPAVTVTLDGRVLTKGTDYVVRYSNNIELGTAMVTVNGAGNYTGTAIGTFTIHPLDINDESIEVETLADKYYTGMAFTPPVNVTRGGNTLICGDESMESAYDYSVSYSNNIEVGEAVVTITGKGYYTGTRTVSFKINVVPENGMLVTDETKLAEAMEKASGTAENPYKIVLANDISLNDMHPLAEGKQIEICGNGYTLTAAVSHYATEESADTGMFSVPSGASLVLSDLMLNGNLMERLVYVYEGGTLDVSSNVILTRGRATNLTAQNTVLGGQVIWNAGTVNFAGSISINNTVNNYYGAIYNCGTFVMKEDSELYEIKVQTAVIYNDADGIFQMEGGILSPNQEEVVNCAVVVYSRGSFTMSGGEISDNRGSDCQIYNYGTFTMTGGKISNNLNNATYNQYIQGGIIGNSRTFIMTGGEISYNQSYGNGGAIRNSGSFTMDGEDAKIVHNRAVSEATNPSASSSGGAVFMTGGTFELKNGSISDNTAYYLSSSGIKQAQNIVTSNSADTSKTSLYGVGGGIVICGGIFKMSGGCVSGNSAPAAEQTSGIYVVADSSGFGWLNLSSELQISGDADIQDTIYLASGRNITITGALGDDVSYTVYQQEDDFKLSENGGTAAAVYAPLTDEEGNVVSEEFMNRLDGEKFHPYAYDPTADYEADASLVYAVDEENRQIVPTKSYPLEECEFVFSDADSVVTDPETGVTEYIYNYTGKPMDVNQMNITATAPDGSVINTADLNYEVEEDADTVNVGEVKVRVTTNRSIYTGEAEIAFRIGNMDLTDINYDSETNPTGLRNVELAAEDVCGKTEIPKVSLRIRLGTSLNYVDLIEGQDYTVAIKTDEETGEPIVDEETGAYTALVTGMGNYTGTLEATYNVTGGLSIDEETGAGTYYDENGVAMEDYTGLVTAEDGTIYYVENGQVTGSTTDVVTMEDGTRVYVENSKVNYSYTGFATAADGSVYYIESGKVTGTRTDVIKMADGTRVYVENSKVNYSYTGFATAADGSVYYIESGKVAGATTGVLQMADGTMVYVENGRVNNSYTGFAKNSKGWWYVEKGKVNAAKNSVIKDAAGKVDGTVSWWYVVGGKVQSGYTGVANYKNANGWWYIKNGKVDFSANTVAKNKNGWWYVVKGQVQFGYTGVANYKNAYGWWYVVNGKVDFKANTVAKNKYGWWYVVGGKVQFGYTGVANYKNAYGWWYVVNGKVDFKANIVAKNKYGWWKVTNGSVDFGFNGIAKNSYGWWYIRGGKVDFSYNGKVTSGGKTYTVKNGKVNR